MNKTEKQENAILEKSIPSIVYKYFFILNFTILTWQVMHFPHLLGGVFGDDLLEFGFDGGDVEGVGDADQLVDLVGQPVVVVALVGGQDHDLLVARRDDPFALGDQLLVELLAGPQAREDDLDVLLRLEAVESDHVPGQIQDPDRLAHLEDEDLAPLSHRPGLQDQLGRLGDAHEVAGDLRMGHGHRAPLGDLLLEEGDHRSGTADDVPESDGDEAGLRIPVAAGGHQFADALGRPHDVGRPHGLVRGDQNEFIDPGIDRTGDHVFHRQHIVVHSLPGIELLHRHMLVRGGVKNDVGPEIFEHPAGGAQIAEVRQAGLHLDLLESSPALHLHLVEVVFAEIEQRHRLRA